MTEARLTIQGLAHRYAGIDALAPLSFSLKAGEVAGFLGVNGAGKSTCLRLIAGLMPIQTGRILINGIDRDRHPVRANAVLGYLPDQPPLHDDQRVEHFLAFAGRLHGLRGPALKRALARELERCRLGEVRGQLIGALSKGYRQRVGLAACLLHQPRLLLLDEPSSGLDPVQQEDFRRLIVELGKDCAVLLSSHQLDEIEACASRVLILHGGRLRADLPLLGIRQPSLILRLRAAPSFEQLRELPGVVDVEAADDERLRLRLERADDSLYTTIAREALARGWGLTELTPGGSELAARFFAISQGARER